MLPGFWRTIGRCGAIAKLGPKVGHRLFADDDRPLRRPVTIGLQETGKKTKTARIWFAYVR